MEHWIQVLADVSLVEFVALAALTSLQWALFRSRGAGWVALSFAILGVLSLTVRFAPNIVVHNDVAKPLLALLLVMPYCLFRFAASFRQPSLPVRLAAALVTIAIVAFTFALASWPLRGEAAPPPSLAYRVSVTVAVGFLFTYVGVRLFMAGRGAPPVAAVRMRLSAVAVAGLEVQVLVAALALHGTPTQLATRLIAVVIGLLFLVALVLPSFVRVVLGRRDDVAFRDAVGVLVSAGDPENLGERLLPRVCALVGASSAALLAKDGTVVARYPIWVTGQDAGDPGPGSSTGEPAPAAGRRNPRITVRTKSGATHVLAVQVSPYLAYFGTEERHELDQLASMVGLAVERCEMAEQLAFQASHDSLTGLANRTYFMERLTEALSHVGRRATSLAVLFIDCDRFKLVNDRADHSAGDLVLQEVANRLTAMTRGVDIVARFGGDEFVAFAELDRDQDAFEMAERIRKGLSEPIVFGTARLVVTSSVGVVVTSDSSDDADLLVRDADNAMYDAKRAGRNQVVLYPAKARHTANRKWGLGPRDTRRLNAG